MQLSAVELIVLLAYFVLTALFAYAVRRITTFSDYSVGSRTVPGLMVFASLAATYIGPGFSIGFTADGFSRGYTLFVLALSYPLQMLLVAFLLAPRLSRFRGCTTIGDVVNEKYGRFSQLLAGIVSVGLCIGFTAIMGKAGGALLQSVTGWGTESQWGLHAHVAVITLLTAALTFTGGVRAVIATDSLHFVWISIVVPVVLLIAFFRRPEPSDLWATASSLTSSGFSGLSPLGITAVVVSFLLGETLIPPYANRALAARTEAASRGGFALAAIYCIVWLAIVATMGVVAHEYVPTRTKPDDVFLAIGRSVLPFGSFGLLVAAGIAIVMSSQESVLNSAAVAFTRDVAGRVRRLSDSQELIASRVATVVIAIIATVAATGAPSIIDGLMFCYSIWAPTMLVALVAALYVRTPRPFAGCLSILAGGCVAGLWHSLQEPFGWPTILVGLGASGGGYALGYAFDTVRSARHSTNESAL